MSEITVDKLAIALDLVVQELRENNQRWADLHQMLANQRNAAIMVLGATEDVLGYTRSIKSRDQRSADTTGTDKR
jgi:hypothetical protein